MYIITCLKIMYEFKLYPDITHYIIKHPIFSNPQIWYEHIWLSILCDWKFNIHILANILNTSQQFVEIFRKKLTNGTNPKTVSIQHLPRIYHQVCNKMKSIKITLPQIQYLSLQRQRDLMPCLWMQLCFSFPLKFLCTSSATQV